MAITHSSTVLFSDISLLKSLTCVKCRKKGKIEGKIAWMSLIWSIIILVIKVTAFFTPGPILGYSTCNIPLQTNGKNFMLNKRASYPVCFSSSISCTKHGKIDHHRWVTVLSSERVTANPFSLITFQIDHSQQGSDRLLVVSFNFGIF